MSRYIYNAHGCHKIISRNFIKLQKLGAARPRSSTPLRSNVLKKSGSIIKRRAARTCFDTAFTKICRVQPSNWPTPQYEKLGPRRYGFHGLSYQYLLKDFAKTKAVVAAHGSDYGALRQRGVSQVPPKTPNHRYDYGLYLASGVPMSTRSGDLDPGVVWYLHRLTNIAAV